MCDCVQLPSVSVTSSGCVEGRSSVEHHGNAEGNAGTFQRSVRQICTGHGDCLPARHLVIYLIFLFPQTQHPSFLLFRPFV